MQNWNSLKPEDFQNEGSERRAVVQLDQSEVSLMMNELEAVEQEHVASFETLLAGWQEQREEIAKRTQKRLQRFLPGRQVDPSELRLWGVELMTEERQPVAATFFYRVAGEYDSTRYQLDQFDGRSVVEMSVEIEDGDVGWEDADLATTNDFD